MVRIFMLYIIATALGAMDCKAQGLVLGKRSVSTPYKFDHKTSLWQSSSLNLPQANTKFKAQADQASCGLQYQNFYIGAQLDTYASLQPALEKIRHFNTMRGAHLTSGGIRLGGFITTKTMLYIKAGFVNQPAILSTAKTAIKAKDRAIPTTSFEPGVGFEWQMPHKLSVAGEIRTAFSRSLNSSEPKKRQSGTVLFNVRYQFGNNK